MESKVQQTRHEMDRPDSPCWIDGRLRIDVGQCIHKGIHRYKIVSKLDEGSFGVVYKVLNTQTGLEYALKITKKEVCHENVHEMMRELQVLKKINRLDSDNKIPILKLENAFQYKGKLCMVFPLMAENILDFMNEDIFRYFRRDHLQHVGYQLFQTLHFLHINGIIHTDLKVDNIMFTNSESERNVQYDENLEDFITIKTNKEICLIDVGLARFDHENSNIEVCNTSYQAPEIIIKCCYDRGSDIWAAGVILFEMWSGKRLFNEKSRKARLAIMEHVLGPTPVQYASYDSSHYKDGILKVSQTFRKMVSSKFSPLGMYEGLDGQPDPQFIDLIRWLWTWTSCERPTADMVLRHPFFDGMEDIYGYN